MDIVWLYLSKKLNHVHELFFFFPSDAAIYQITHQIRADQIKLNGKRIDEAKTEGEMWKIINTTSIF